jgi:hypothetical protein
MTTVQDAKLQKRAQEIKSGVSSREKAHQIGQDLLQQIFI